MKKSVCLGFILILMLFRAGYVTEGARYGLLLWYNSVVPALFPFMVLSGMIVAGGGISALMTPFYLILHPFFPVTREGCYVLVSGLLCGYPMGAKTCADFLREGRLSQREGNFLMAICNHPSPMFLLGYVYPFFAPDTAVSRLLLSVYIPVLLLAFLAKIVYFPPGPLKTDGPVNIFDGSGPHDSSVDESILSAVEVLCKIGGYLMLFSIFIVFLRHAAWIPARVRMVLIASMEMTTGIREAAASLNFPASGMLSVFALTFGGFSGLFQTKSVIAPMDSQETKGMKKNAGLSIRQYFLWKLLHGILSAGLFSILTYGRLLPAG